MIDENENVIVSQVEKDEEERVKKWTEDQKDSDGNLISKRVDEYSYYQTGEIDTIALKAYAGEKLISKKIIKHYTDDRQPRSEDVLLC